MAACLFLESDGGRGQWISLGTAGDWQWTRPGTLGFSRNFPADPHQRSILLPQYGKNIRGHDLTMTTAISVKGLSKRYRIGAAQTKFRYGMLRDVFVDTLTTPIRLAKSLMGSGNGLAPKSNNFIWALKDISFNVEEGKVLGIVR